MKKRLFSIFLSLALVLSMMPLGLIAVQAEEPTAYDLWVCGVQVTSENAEDVFNDGKVSYDAQNKMLTLNSYTFSGTGYYENSGEYGSSDEYSAVFSKIDGLTINLQGTNSLTEAGGH